ncbi:uncharacterized protein LOC127864362 isoform X3 [Dreissena polymorpha]|uniref:uncharacterized protein LOC127864362 isoform X2 n=1 Tax=Dreissena polymorpha TaxID=45954 RepID=UPI0022648F55|nr:uncharacterized protein LOC127864362 isoform X2 [Dreissena polymorpha]XP_052259980.1 uncharacterized protein LOC127864362 isoform X3 [Dreissena polymorpha]
MSLSTAQQHKTHNMFTAACANFVKTVEPKTLHATPSLDEKDNVKLFQVVKKYKHQRVKFWERKLIFRPSEFQLTDMLVDRKSLNVKQESTDFEQKFNCTEEYFVDGALDIKFGRVQKQELVYTDLIGELCNRQINMEHPYVRQMQIRRNKRNSLYLISGVAFLPDGGEIHRKTVEDAKAKGDPLKVNASAGFGSVIVLAKSTAVAFTVQELEIDRNTGHIGPVNTSAAYDVGGWIGASILGYEEYEDKEDVSVDCQLDHAREVFSYLLDLDQEARKIVNTNLLKLMKYPSDLVDIASLLNYVEAGLEVDINVSDLAESLVSPSEVWQYVLQQAEFSVTDDSLNIPKSTERISMFGEFFDAATELEESLLVLVTDLSPSNADNILPVLRYGISKKRGIDWTKMKEKVDYDDTSFNLLKQLNYDMRILSMSPPENVPSCMYALYWVLFALYGK